LCVSRLYNRQVAIDAKAAIMELITPLLPPQPTKQRQNKMEREYNSKILAELQKVAADAFVVGKGMD